MTITIKMQKIIENVDFITVAGGILVYANNQSHCQINKHLFIGALDILTFILPE